MGRFLDWPDLSPLSDIPQTVADLMIEDVESLAVMAAPCITESEFPYRDQVKSLLRQAVLRWYRAGEGGVTTRQESAGPFSMSQTVDSRVAGEGRLWPSEERRLQALCREWKREGVSGRKAFTILPGRR